MSWDVIMLKNSSEILNPESLPEAFEQEIGSRADVASTLQKILPDLKFSDSQWASLDNENFAIEFNITKDDPVKSVFLHIYGDSDDVIQIIRAICENANWRAYDITTSSFMDFEKYPAEGFHKWKKYRNQVLKSLDNK